MAPERFRGECDARGDIYSLGMTLYEALTLRHAFRASEHAELIRQIGSETPPRPRSIRPEIPRDLETIVLKAIAPDLRGRYTSAAEMGEDLARFLDGRPILARRTTPPERLARWIGRNRVVACLGLVILLLALVSGYFIRLFLLGPPRPFGRPFPPPFGRPGPPPRVATGRAGRRVRNFPAWATTSLSQADTFRSFSKAEGGRRPSRPEESSGRHLGPDILGPTDPRHGRGSGVGEGRADRLDRLGELRAEPERLLEGRLGAVEIAEVEEDQAPAVPDLRGAGLEVDGVVEAGDRPIRTLQGVQG
jgi:hypothetical protein